MEAANPLGTEKVSKLLWQFSIPAIIGMVVNALYTWWIEFISDMLLGWEQMV